MTKPIDLSICKPGARLLTRGGNTVTYVGHVHGRKWGHMTQHPNLGYVDTYTDDGHCLVPSSQCQDDIVKILDTGSMTLLSWLFYFALGAAAGTIAGVALMWLLEHL